MANPEMDVVVVRGDEKNDILTIFELPFEEGKEWDDRLKRLKRVEMAGYPITLAYAPRLGIHIYIGCQGYFLGHITTCKPNNMRVDLFDKKGRQYIRIVLTFVDGQRWATAFFIETREGQLYFTPLVSKRTLDRRIQELKEEVERGPRYYTRRHASPYEPKLEKLSSLNKSKEYFYSATDLQLHLMRQERARFAGINADVQPYP